jgi:MinD-like ATPase involved in chromosome partitioning or flagellar assembly
VTTATITIHPGGAGSITLDGSASPISAAGVHAAQAVAMRQVKRHAERTGAPVHVQVTDPQGTSYLNVAADGTITRLTPPQSTDAEVDQDPAHEASTLTPEADSQPTVLPPQPDEAPTAVPSDAATDEVDADPRWAEIAQQPATHGLRGALNGMGLKLAPAEEELTERREALRQEIAREEETRRADEQLAREEVVQETRRAARAREAAEKDRAERAIIQTNYDEPKTASFMNDKGGVGKTTDALCIAAAAGRIRGGDVIAWDANETRGTMGFRALKDRHSRSVVDFLQEAAEDFTTVEGSRRTTLTRYTRGQGDNKFSVLASDESRKKQDQVDGDAFRTVHEIVGRFHSLIIVDTGNNHEVSHFKAALAATDQLVIPVSPGEDGAYAAELMLDNFISWGYGDLVKNAVVLLHDSATQRGDARAIAAKFENRVRAILPIPFDPILDAGGQIDFDALQPSTRAAYQTAAAAISHGLADTKEG